MSTTGGRGLVLRESEDLHSTDTEALECDLRKRQAGDKVKMRVGWGVEPSNTASLEVSFGGKVSFRERAFPEGGAWEQSLWTCFWRVGE